MSRILTMTYGVACYLAANLAILYAIAFVGDFAFAPYTVNRGTAGDLPTAIVVDLILLGLFAIQHSVMARPAFKRMWTKVVPPAAERATYVLAAAVALTVPADAHTDAHVTGLPSPVRIHINPPDPPVIKG